MSETSIAIIGAASPLGASLFRRLAADTETTLIAADLPSRLNYLSDLARNFGGVGERIRLAGLDLKQPGFGLPRGTAQLLHSSAKTIYHLGHTRNRTYNSSAIREHNMGMCHQVLELAKRCTELERLVVVTDVGLIGDYPGRFYESWTDVQQVPFDEVDRTSVEVEILCNAEPRLPITRARIGLLSDLTRTLPWGRHWRPAAEVLVPAMKLLKFLPRFVAIPTFVAKGCLAPLTPIPWATDALLHLAQNDAARGKAVHLVLEAGVPMTEVLNEISEVMGAARVRPGVPMRLIATAGHFPGFKEMARKQADQLASWWTPHRYCLSHNDVDRTMTKSLLPSELHGPSWEETRTLFFRQNP